MTIKRKNNLWIPPSLSRCGYTIILTGGGFEKYSTPKGLYSDDLLLCSPTKTGYLYPFDPERQPKQQPPYKYNVFGLSRPILEHSPVFYQEKYIKIGCFQITQYVYVFKLGDPAKKAFESVKKEYERQLEAYESRMTAYYAKKNECFHNRWEKKERRKDKVCSITDKASKRNAMLEIFPKKASN
jgi:hypothetical protein